MKKVVCYGDSNTFGYNPENGSRFDKGIRWTSVLQQNMGTEYEVINEGLCDRTGFIDNPKGFLFSSSKHFPKFIAESGNIDILILWIGTNDLQFQYNINIETIETGLKKIIKLAQTKAKKIIIIPPVVLHKDILYGAFNYQFDNSSIEKSRYVGKIYKRIADIYNCEYFDINEFISPSDTDGLHFDKKAHEIIADKLAYFLSA